mgnify:CR=1 FL=1
MAHCCGNMRARGSPCSPFPIRARTVIFLMSERPGHEIGQSTNPISL